jgi:hypothetical protein
MNPQSLSSLLASAGRSKYSLMAFGLLLIYSSSAMFFKKERVAIRGAVFASMLALVSLLAMRLFPILHRSDTNPSVYIDVHGNDNGTAVGNNNIIRVKDSRIQSTNTPVKPSPGEHK